MKPDPTEEDAFRSLLAKEAAKERTLVQQLARPGGVALQALQLAGVQYKRALRELPGAVEAVDFDEPYLSAYRAVISGCKALLAVYGYRIQGGDGAHLETLRLGAMGLVIWDRHAGQVLEEVREPMRSARNEAEYQRPGVTTAAELKEIFDTASTVLRAISTVVPTLVGAENPLIYEWPVPEVAE